jgi:hypothetical protein
MPKMVCVCGNVIEIASEGSVQCQNDKCKATWTVKKLRENLFLVRRG